MSSSPVTRGRLTIVRQSGHDRHGNVLWLCLCACGSPTGLLEVATGNLRRTKSCGCLKKSGDPSRTHGHAPADKVKRSSTYSSWVAMRTRCKYVSQPQFKNYGGRGIKVCAEWQDSFENFLRDMGERPPGKTLDRYPNNDGDYEPGNCRWATLTEQRANQRRCRAA